MSLWYLWNKLEPPTDNWTTKAKGKTGLHTLTISLPIHRYCDQFRQIYQIRPPPRFLLPPQDFVPKLLSPHFKIFCKSKLSLDGAGWFHILRSRTRERKENKNVRQTNIRRGGWYWQVVEAKKMNGGYESITNRQRHPEVVFSFSN